MQTLENDYFHQLQTNYPNKEIDEEYDNLDILKIEPNEILRTDATFVGMGAQATVQTLKYKDDLVAIKMIPSNQKQTFFKEVNILKMANNHPNIIPILGVTKVFDIKTEKVYYCLVMKYVKQNLQNLIFFEQTELTNKDKLKIAIGIASGMKFLHHDLEEPIIHQDLKPENILVTNDFEPKIIDFGLAKNKYEKIVTGGSAFYMVFFQIWKLISNRLLKCCNKPNKLKKLMFSVLDWLCMNYLPEKGHGIPKMENKLKNGLYKIRDQSHRIKFHLPYMD